VKEGTDELLATHLAPKLVAHNRVWDTQVSFRIAISHNRCNRPDSPPHRVPRVENIATQHYQQVPTKSRPEGATRTSLL